MQGNQPNFIFDENCIATNNNLLNARLKLREKGRNTIPYSQDLVLHLLRFSSIFLFLVRNGGAF